MRDRTSLGQERKIIKMLYTCMVKAPQLPSSCTTLPSTELKFSLHRVPSHPVLSSKTTL